MRTLIALCSAFSIAACGNASTDQEQLPQAALGPGLWAGGERDGLCVTADGSAAFIQFGEADANCMAQGRIESEDEALDFVPRGDDQCRIPLLREGDVITFGQASQSCAYYCGGEAILKAEGLRLSDGAPGELRDIAGDPLC